MNRRSLTRALLALAVPALLVPTVAQPASAATRPPAVPTQAAVAKIYPHLKGGYTDVTRKPKVTMHGKKCDSSVVVKGATGREGTYFPQLDADMTFTGARPGVMITAEQFPSAKVAQRYLRAGQAETRNCPATDSPKDKITVKRIRFKLGAERWGVRIRIVSHGSTTVMNGLFARQGKQVVSVISMSTDGGAAPSIAKSVALTRLALKTAR